MAKQPSIGSYTSDPKLLGRKVRPLAISVPSGAGQFNPRTISSLFGWYDFTDPTTMFTDAGITNVAADGALVYQVNDKSGNSRTLSQAAASGSRPIYKTNIITGHSLCRFDGISQFWKAATFGSVAQPFTVFSVARWNADPAAGTLFDGEAVNTMRQYRSAVNTISIFAGAGLVGTATQGLIEATQIYSGIYNGASSSISLGGVSKGAGDAGASGITGITVGDHGSTGSPFAGDAAEILIFNAALTSANQNLVGKYLAGKFGLSWTTVP